MPSYPSTPAFRRRHYEMLADMLVQARSDALTSLLARGGLTTEETELALYGALRASQDLLDCIIDMLRSDNPNFDVARFRKACRDRSTGLASSILKENHAPEHDT